MRFLSRFFQYLAFVFFPLFAKGRWFIWFLLLLILMFLGNSITAIRMEIPSRDQVTKIKGIFVDSSRGVHSRTGMYPMMISDKSGVRHKCDCVPLRYSNCLGRTPSDHAEIRDQLDEETLKRTTLHKAMIKWLDGKQGEMWVYPNRSLIGTNYSCYQIMDDTRIYRSYERSVEEYRQSKYAIGVYLVWLITASVAVGLTFFILIRTRMFIKGVRNG